MTTDFAEHAPPPRTEGLDPLDRQRAASLADEGGSSGATVEAQDVLAGGIPITAALAALSGVCLGFLLLRSLRR